MVFQPVGLTCRLLPVKIDYNNRSRYPGKIACKKLNGDIQTASKLPGFRDIRGRNIRGLNAINDKEKNRDFQMTSK